MPEQRSTPRALSYELLQKEIDGQECAEAIAAAVQRGFGRFRDSLCQLIGHEGFRALLDRALHRTKWEAAALELATAPSPDVFANLAETAKREGAVRLVEDSMELMANLVDLLCTFIGEDLTTRIVERILDEAAAQKLTAASSSKEGT